MTEDHLKRFAAAVFAALPAPDDDLEDVEDSAFNSFKEFVVDGDEAIPQPVRFNVYWSVIHAKMCDVQNFHPTSVGGGYLSAFATACAMKAHDDGCEGDEDREDRTFPEWLRSPYEMKEWFKP